MLEGCQKKMPQDLVVSPAPPVEIVPIFGCSYDRPFFVIVALFAAFPYSGNQYRTNMR